MCIVVRIQKTASRLLEDSIQGSRRHPPLTSPAALKDGRPHRITVRVAEAESTDVLAGKKVTITCR
jgi:hypothetical protein